MADRGENSLKRPENDAADEGAIDDSEDLDDDMVQLQQIKSETRRRQSKAGGESRIQQLLPVPFLPNIRPLTISDLESCVALENASFSDPGHRCTREKVSAPAVFSLLPFGSDDALPTRGRNIVTPKSNCSQSSSTVSQTALRSVWACS